MSDTEEAPHVAVTGAAGYIGSRVVADIQSSHPDWEVTALDNFYHGDVREIGDVTVKDVDIRNRDVLEETLAGADVVLHLAAISGVDDCEDKPDQAYEVNVGGTANVAWFCRKTGAGMAFPFSMAVLGDPVSFPIAVDHPRDPLNTYGWTKYVSERDVESFADGAFPAVQFMISNLYGDHRVGDRRVSKGTVINFFVDRALSGEPLTVYEPGSQSRNFVHVRDVASAFLAGTERLLARRATGETGSQAYTVATDEDPSVHEVADLVADTVAETAGERPPVELVENPRGNETLVENFAVDTERTRADLDWAPDHTVEGTVRDLLDRLS